MHERWTEKFWSRVQKAEPFECWLWAGAKLPTGYGRLYPEGRTGYYAHRLSWEIANGREVPSGLHVMHACDNPQCVNPNHLSVGTRSDNMRDASVKGRLHGNSMPGELHPGSKLTDAQVAEIKRRLAAGASRLAIAIECGVTKGAIKHIAAGRLWKHIVANELPASLPYPRVNARTANHGGFGVPSGV